MFYDGYDFSGLLTVERVGRSLLPDVSVETASVPGKDGGVFRSASVGMLSLSVDVRIVVPTPGTRNQKAAFESARRKAAGLLLKRGPRPLVVDDAPGPRVRGDPVRLDRPGPIRLHGRHHARVPLR